MTVTRGFGALLLAALTLGACGGSGKAGSETPGTQTSSATQVASAANGSGTGEACELVRQDDATKLFGHPASPKVDPSGLKPADSVCLWEYKSNPGKSDDVIYLLQVRIYPTAAFYGVKTYPGAKPVTGLGDRAFVTEPMGLRGVMLQYVKNGKTYTFAYAINAIEGDKPDPSQMPGQLEGLVREADARAS
jgi:hypothetical protein